MVQKRSTLFKQVLTAFVAPSLTEQDAMSMDRFLRSKDGDLSEIGVQLKHKVKAQLSFYKVAKASISNKTFPFLSVSPVFISLFLINLSYYVSSFEIEN